MAVEPRRGCGYRKVGGLYLCSDSIGEPCHALPIPLDICPVCHAGIHPARGWTTIVPGELLRLCDRFILGGGPELNMRLKHCWLCPACNPPGGRHGLLWVGEKYYTPGTFAREAKLLGVSKRIAAIPRDLILGETFVYLAHRYARSAVTATELQMMPADEQNEPKPGIFTVFRPTRLEYIIRQSELDAMEPERRAKKESQGIRFIPVPDDDPDHNA